MLEADFPYDQDFREQHSLFVPRPVPTGMVTEREAIEAAGEPQFRAGHPELQVEAWFGEFEADYPLPGPKRRFFGGRGIIAPNTRVLIWLVRFSNYEVWLKGRGGSSMRVTESFTLLHGKTGHVLRAFSRPSPEQSRRSSSGTP